MLIVRGASGPYGSGGRSTAVANRLVHSWVGLLEPRVCRVEWGGSFIRPEATGYGVVFFAEEVLKDKGESLEVSQHAWIHESGEVRWNL